MNAKEVFGHIARIREAGFRENEMNIPSVSRKRREAQALPEDIAEDIEDGQMESTHQKLLLSDYPYTIKGSFAFALLSSGLWKDMEAGKGSLIEENRASGTVYKFGKTKASNWAEKIANLDESGIKSVADSIQANVPREMTTEAKFAVHGKGNEAHIYEKTGNSWKRIFSMPFEHGIWPVPGDKFLMLYSAGKNIYNRPEFNPSLGYAIWGASPSVEYGWSIGTEDCSAILETASEMAEDYADCGGAIKTRQFREFSALSYLMRDAAFAEFEGRRMHSPEFSANIPYMIARANVEKKLGNYQEALFMLRTASDLALLFLRASPFEGEMLELPKFFDANENVAPLNFSLELSVLELFGVRGIKIEGKLKKTGGGEKEGAGERTLREGKDYFTKDNKICMRFGALLHLLISSPQRPEQVIFLAEYGAGMPALSVLGQEKTLMRGSDIFKAEFLPEEASVKRAMVLENATGGDIKKHAGDMLKVAELKAQGGALEEMGSWGLARYALATGADKKDAMALMDSRRFY